MCLSRFILSLRPRHHNNVHGDDDHPEDPRRIWKIFDALNCAQCTDRMIKIPTREASVEELVLVHTENHIDNITKTAGAYNQRQTKNIFGHCYSTLATY
jgi:histone deacetylase 6